MSFTWPLALLGLLGLPVLLWLALRYERRRRAGAARFGNPDLLPNVIDRSPGRLRFLPLVLALLALAAMIVGVARPKATVSVPREEATIVIAVDVSRSMKATDVEPTRLDAARAAAKAFLADVPERFRVGVVTFATRAAVGVPPTEDRELVAAALDELIPGEGTAIGDAVALSLEISRVSTAAGGEAEAAEEQPPRAILMISDGAQDGGIVQPDEAAQQARTEGVPVHGVLVGTPDGVVEETLVGGYTVRIQVPPSPETLELLASATGGELFTALDTDQLAAVYEDLGSRLGTRRELREITDVFAAGAAALLLVAGGLSTFLFRRVP